jgi:multidrug efflux pump subunit AcrB
VPKGAQVSEPTLNLAGRLAATFVDSKLTPLFVVAVFLLGLLSALITPREENPQILVPGAVVTYQLPGSTAAEVERLIVAPMEARLREIGGVEHSFATAAVGVGQIQLQFYVGVDEDDAISRVRQRVAAYRGTLPPGTAEPVVRQLDVDDVPIVTVSLASRQYDDYALRRIAERMAERLSTLEAVSVVDIHGGRTREIRLDLDPARMQAHGLTLGEGIAILQASNLSAVIGTSVQKGRSRSVQLKGQLGSPDELRCLPLGIHDGRLIYVEDIGEVVDGPAADPEQLTRLGFGPADPRYALPELHGELASVTISVAKKQNTNAVVVAREVLDLVARMQARFVPSDVVVVTTRNDGVEANHTVNKLIFDLAIAIGAVLLVLVPILGLRQALIVCLVVPLVLSLTLAVDMVAGVTVNRISLFALILALGMLVDDAIVVMENIHRHYEEGVQDRRRAAVLATHEIGKPTTTATITIVLVFSSLQLLTGMNGAYFAPISFNVTLAIAFSLLVAYTVVPWACVRWLPHQHTAEAPAHSTGGGALQRRYQRLVDPLIRSAGRRRWAVCGVLAALLASMLMPSWQFLRPGGPGGPVSAGGVALSIMPKEDKNTFAITLDLPEDAAVELTDRVAREFGEVIGRHPQVSNYLTYVGLPGVADFSALVSGDSQRGDPNQAEIRVNLIDKSLRHKTSMQIVEELREATAPIRARYPRMDVRFMEAPPGPPNRAVVLANIHGEDENTLRELSAAVKERFRQTWGMVDVFDSMPVDSEQIDLVVDKEKALLSGVTTADVEQTLRAVMDGMVVSQAHVPGERNPVPIRLRVPRELEVDPQRLDRVLVRNAQGQTVPLSELVQAVLRPRENPILRKDDERVTYVGGNVAAATAPAFVIMDMERHLDGLPVAGTPLRTGNLTLLGQVPDTIDGYELLWDGEMRLTLDAAREMGAINGVVLVLIYLLMVGVYRSFSLPLMAMTAIPFGLIGIFPGHWLLGIPFSMASMIGVVALAGVVIRNSLLIIDFVHDYQRRGHSLEEAVKLAGGVRLRPIALTASTVILGTLVLYRDPMFAGLATSLISGTIASTVLTLLLLPPLYYRMALNHPEWARGI